MKRGKEKAHIFGSLKTIRKKNIQEPGKMMYFMVRVLSIHQIKILLFKDNLVMEFQYLKVVKLQAKIFLNKISLTMYNKIKNRRRRTNFLNNSLWWQITLEPYNHKSNSQISYHLTKIFLLLFKFHNNNQNN